MFQRFKLLIALGWITTLIVGYVSVFPIGGFELPFPHLHPESLLPYISPLLSLLFILLSANGWGTIYWRHSGLVPMERFLFSSGAGLGLLSLIVLISDGAGVISPTLYFGVVLTGIILFIIKGARHIRGSVGRRFYVLLACVSIPIVVSLIGALAPPTQFDSLVYHLSLPSQYMAAGKIFQVPHNIFFAFPQNTEMLYQLGLMLDGDILSNLIAWSFFLLTGFGIFFLTRRYYNGATAFFASLAWFYTPNVMLLATGTYVDLALAFYILLAFYSFVMWDSQESKLWVITAGIFSGLALGTKYTAVIPILLIASLIVFSNKRNAPVAGIVFMFIAAAVFSPWLIKNTLFLKNPLAPWATSFFQHSLIHPAQAQGYLAEVKGHGLPIGSLRDYFLLPWNLTVKGVLYGGGFDILGPLFVVFIPLLFLRFEIGRIPMKIIVFSAGYCVLWLFTGKVLRFLVPVMPFLCILSAQGIVNLRGARWARIVSTVALVVILGHNLLFFAWIESMVDPYAPVLSGESRSRYLSRKLNYYPSIERCVNTLRYGSKVMFLGETRSYYATTTAVVPTVFDTHPLIQWANASENADEIARCLKKSAFTHLLINQYEFKRLNYAASFTPEGSQRFDDLLNRLCIVRYHDNYCRVYEITN